MALHDRGSIHHETTDDVFAGPDLSSPDATSR